MLYTDRDGRARFREDEVTLPEGTPQAMLSEVFASSGYQLRHSPVGFRSQWHCTPKPQWVFILAGEMEIGLQDGSSRLFKPGDTSFPRIRFPKARPSTPRCTAIGARSAAGARWSRCSSRPETGRFRPVPVSCRKARLTMRTRNSTTTAPMVATIKAPINPPSADRPSWRNKTSDHRAHDAEQDVAEDAEAAAPHELSCQPSGRQADQYEPEKFHIVSSFSGSTIGAATALARVRVPVRCRVRDFAHF